MKKLVTLNSDSLNSNNNFWFSFASLAISTSQRYGSLKSMSECGLVCLGRGRDCRALKETGASVCDWLLRVWDGKIYYKFVVAFEKMENIFVESSN